MIGSIPTSAAAVTTKLIEVKSTSRDSNNKMTTNDSARSYYPFNGGKQNVMLSSSISSSSSSAEISATDTSAPSSSTSSPSSLMSVAKPNSSTNVTAPTTTTTTASAPNNNTSSGSSSSSSSPVCKNCLTLTTPLWRRDENGAVLCNACGLFLKLHGRPRPISLKTDVIKSRNRKGTHHHHHNGNNETSPSSSAISSPMSPRMVAEHKRSHSDDKKRKQHTYTENKSIVNNSKKMKTTEETLSSSESKDIRSAATTLETLMSSDSSKPKLKPKMNNHAIKQEQVPSITPTATTLSPSQSATQLPHLSSLLGEVNSNNQTPLPNNTIEDRTSISSPNMMPQNPSMSRQLSFHMTSINDVLNTANGNSNANANPNEETNSIQAPNAHKNIPLTANSSSTSLVRGPSVSHGYTSPPPPQPPAPPQRAATLPIPHSIQKAPHSNDLQQQGQNSAIEIPINVTLQNEEEVIKLKTRISELELVTDLYKRHIFELDEKCKSLQGEIQSLRQ